MEVLEEEVRGLNDGRDLRYKNGGPGTKVFERRKGVVWRATRRFEDCSSPRVPRIGFATICIAVEKIIRDDETSGGA